MELIRLKKFITFIVLISLILVFGCSQQQTNTVAQNSNVKISAPSQPETVTPDLTVERTVDQKTDLQKATEYCQTISVIVDQDKCYYEAAVKFSNQEACDKIQAGLGTLGKSKAEYIADCKDKALMTYYIDALDYSKCISLSNNSYINECVTEVAKKKNDAQICSLSTDSIKKNFCVIIAAVYNKNVDLCDSLIGITKDDCQKQVGVAAKNKAICDLISTLSIKNDCYLGADTK